MADDPISAFFASWEKFFFAPGYLAKVELLIAARSDAKLEAVVFPIISKARRTLDALWVETLSHQGHGRGQAERFVEMSHYLLHGMFFVESWLPFDVDRAAVLDDWRKLALSALPVTRPQRAITSKGSASVPAAGCCPSFLVSSADRCRAKGVGLIRTGLSRPVALTESGHSKPDAAHVQFRSQFCPY